ncbi:MAG: hypothetical protein GYA17_18685, partial [Chloroflexi bacterium]|nr:hypothetical protein [Chloroflexota bacterium]
FLYGLWRVLERNDAAGLWLVTLSTALHFVIKETAFLYTAQALVLLLGVFLAAAVRMLPNPRPFQLYAAGAVTAGLAALALTLLEPAGMGAVRPLLVLALVAGAAGCALGALRRLAGAVGWDAVRGMPSLGLLALLGSLVLPLLGPFPVSLLGFDPLDFTNPTVLLLDVGWIVLALGISIAVGIGWNPAAWWRYAGLFWAIFAVFYTTFFSNPGGLLNGAAGGLGYWLTQQAEQKGGQPHYYYALILMPLYEFLAYAGTLLAVVMARHRRPAQTGPDGADPGPQPGARLSFLGLSLYWACSSLLVFSLAGERMPWLTVHITLGFLLAAGWGLGRLVDGLDWRAGLRRGGLPAALLGLLFLAALASLGQAFSAGEGPAGLGQALLPLLAGAACLVGMFYLLRGWPAGQVYRLLAVEGFLVLGVLTARAAYRAAFIDYDSAAEYLVYAHAAPAPKQVLAQIEALGGEQPLRVAYGGEALYPYWWYLRRTPEAYYFGTTPTRQLRQYDVVIAGEDLLGQMEPALGEGYHSFDYQRLWWPNQDYWGLTWARAWGVVADPAMRSAVWQIWLNRDYRAYARLSSSPQQFEAPTWSPSRRMRVYVRKDLVAWPGARPPAGTETDEDPYAARLNGPAPLQSIGAAGEQPGQFQSPRGLAVAPDGSLYVADTDNHRVQHLAPDGSVLQVWGQYADAGQGTAPGGTFNEPWDVAAGPDGTVYVADTWNHRIQHFSARGDFIDMWGTFGQGQQPDAFWGPRSLAVDGEGRV